MRIVLGIAAVVAASCVGTLDGPIGENPPPNAEPLAGCAMSCHGNELSNAPPKGITGLTETTAIGVGAHAQHMEVSGTWHRKVECADCHVVPQTDNSPGHIDGDNKAEVTFAAIAGTATWSGTTCTTRCHGQTAWGGSHTTPTWTQVDGTQSTCGSCHGTPPPTPHPTVTNNNVQSGHPAVREHRLPRHQDLVS